MPSSPPEAVAVIQSLINDSYGWFVDIVAERRKLDRPTALRLADGRVYSGRQALTAGLIDEVGGEGEAFAWLVKEQHIAGDLRIVEWKKEEPASSFSFAEQAVLILARQAGLDPVAAQAGGLARFLPRGLSLDGLLSVWQAPAALNDAEGAAR